MVQMRVLSDEWLSRYELLKNLNIKLQSSVTRIPGLTAIALLVLRTGELKSKKNLGGCTHLSRRLTR